MRPATSACVLAALAGALAGCPSAPKYRVSAIVRMAGRGDEAWDNARGAVRAVALAQNLRRLVREVQRHRLPVLDVEDPVRVLQEMIVARRVVRGEVRVRIYGDSRWELMRLCRGLLALWETEGLFGISRGSGLAAQPRRSPGDEEADRAAGRALAEAEEAQRRLAEEKQKLLAEQIDLGRKWQDADAAIAAKERALLAARKDVAVAEGELRRLRDVLRAPLRERYRLLGDADALRLSAEVAEAEGALKRAADLPAEVRARVRDVVEQKRRALQAALGRIEREAESRVAEARERLAAAERAHSGAEGDRSAASARRESLRTRLGELDRAIAAAAAKVRDLRSRPRTASRPEPEVKVYRIVDVVRRCRARRLEN
jgi:hypothetical protein